MRTAVVTWLLLLAACRLAEMSAPRPRAAASSCGDGQFSCSNHRCIIERWRCDGDDDCGDGSDEDPLMCGQRSCKTDQFQCVNTTGSASQCIPASWRCDGAADCTDGSDELQCAQSCTPEQFTCGDGKCINKRWACDGDNDCDDGSDEQNCQERPSCNAASHFTCASGECVAATSRCDGDRDCSDGSDEQGCPVSSEGGAQCRPGEVKCGDGFICIFHAWLCDGDADCPDGSDEDPSRCGSHKCAADQFQCAGSGECIPLSRVCSGAAECADASDERNCSAECNPAQQVRCGNGTCLDASLACNGVDDCGDGSDEGSGCGACSRGNGGCSHGCQERPDGRRCVCPSGYRLQADGVTCEDVDECEDPGACSHICINQVGHFKCECHAGYERDPSDHRFCKALGAHASLLVTHRTDIRKVGLYQRQVMSIVDDASAATSVDYNFRTGMVYWSDLIERTVYSAPIDGASRRAVLLYGVRPQGLAVDWLYGRLYWTCSEQTHSGVQVTALDGTFHRTLVHTENDEPRAIAVDPIEGWMYWSDWGSQPKIERAGMDGSRRQTIVDSAIQWPNGLTLDLERRRIFWIDTRRKVLESADLDGGNRRVVISSQQTLHRPFSLTTFEDSVFWTDWERRAVFSANKFTGGQVAIVARLGSLEYASEVRAYHPYRQPSGTNHCLGTNGGCSHLCLPAPAVPGGRRTSCACPEGLLLGPDGLSCTETDPSTTPRPDSAVAGSTAAARAEAEPSPAPESSVTGVAVTAVVLVVIIVALAAFILYRRRTTKGFGATRFHNPSYKKSLRDVVTLQKAKRPVFPVAADNEILITPSDQRDTV